MLVIPRPLLDRVRAHARETYPHECCGILIGRDGDGARTVTEVRRARNLNAARAHDRYEMDPRAIAQAERDLRARRERGEAVEIVGYYHSHPDQPSAPSRTDTDLAWPVYAYVIVGVRGGEPADVTAWVLPRDGAAFETIEIRVDGD